MQGMSPCCHPWHKGNSGDDEHNNERRYGDDARMMPYTNLQ